MSVRAYRITKLVHAKKNTFNLWNDSKLVDFLDFSDQMNDNGSGVIEITVNKLEQAVKKAKELEIDEDTLKGLKRDIRIAKRRGDEFIDYTCF